MMTDLNQKNLAHAWSIEMNGYFLLCDHQPLCHQLRFTLLITIQFMILYFILCSNVPLKIEIVLLFVLCSVEKYCILNISIDDFHLLDYGWLRPLIRGQLTDPSLTLFIKTTTISETMGALR